jgi:hypothetical protein
LFSRILKNNGIGFQSVICFIMNHFLRSNHRPMIEELSDIKNNCHYGGEAKQIAIDKAIVPKIIKKEKKSW